METGVGAASLTGGTASGLGNAVSKELEVWMESSSISRAGKGIWGGIFVFEWFFSLFERTGVV